MFDSATPDPQNTVCFNIQQAIDLVAGWTDLSDQRRRDLVCALNTTARLIGLPPGAVLITPQHLRPSLLKQSPVAFGLTGGRMRNIRSCLKTVLRRLRVIDRDDTPLTDDWAALINRMPERKRAGLVGLARYGSAHSFAPSDMNDDLMEAFSSWLENRTLSARPRKHAGETRGAWNRAVNIVAGWPQVKLSFLREVGQFILPLQEFPLSFQKDLDAFGDRLSATPLDSLLDDVEPPAVRDGTASMKKACRPATVRTRKDHVRWAASALAAMGTPVEDITNLTCLVTPPELVKQILRFFYDRAGGQRSAAGGHVADVLRMIAKYHAGLDDGEITKMKRWAKPVTLKYEGMTEKNARHIRQMLDPKAQAQLLVLPSALMASARKLRSQEHSVEAFEPLRSAYRPASAARKSAARAHSLLAHSIGRNQERSHNRSPCLGKPIQIVG
jgi:hypothetical protein